MYIHFAALMSQSRPTHLKNLMILEKVLMSLDVKGLRIPLHCDYRVRLSPVSRRGCERRTSS